MVRSPKMANIMALYTISGSLDTAITAGTLSKANITSDSSITAKHKNSGVATNAPLRSFFGWLFSGWFTSSPASSKCASGYSARASVNSFSFRKKRWPYIRGKTGKSLCTQR